MRIIKLIYVEHKKNMPIFLTLSIINLLFFIASLFIDSEMFEVIAFLFTLVAYSLMISIIFINLYNDLYLGKDMLLLMAPIKTSTILIIKNFIYISGLFLFWLPSLFRIIYGKFGPSLDNLTLVLSYMNVTKLLGIIAGTLLITCIVVCSKKIKHRIGSIAFIGIVFLSIIITNIIGIISIYQNTFNKIELTIGMGSNFAFNQYATFIPIQILPIDPSIQTVMDTAFFEQIPINLFIIVASFIISLIVVDYSKNDYLGK